MGAAEAGDASGFLLKRSSQEVPIQDIKASPQGTACWPLDDAAPHPGVRPPADLTGNAAQVMYLLSSLPERIPIVELVRLARLRWRVEQDYRECKGGLGLDHFEGRGWPGWHHHVTLVSVAYRFLVLERLRSPNLVAAA